MHRRLGQHEVDGELLRRQPRRDQGPRRGRDARVRLALLVRCRLLLQQRRRFRSPLTTRTAGPAERTRPATARTTSWGPGRSSGRTVTFELRHPLCSPRRRARLLPRLPATRSAWTSCTSSTEPASCTRERMYSPERLGGPRRSRPLRRRPGTSSSSRTGTANLEIYRMNADGSAQTRLTNDPATDNVPSISPGRDEGRLLERPRG